MNKFNRYPIPSLAHALALSWLRKHQPAALRDRGNPAAVVLGIVFVLGGLHSSPAEVSFEKDILPIFETNCQGCHGSDKQKSGLRLDSAQAIMKGGESGEPVFVAGDAEQSHIVRLVTEAVRGEVMPPEGERLNDDEIGKIKAWINAGAQVPGIDLDTRPAPETDHWSFQPIRRPDWPGLNDSFIAGGIDGFILRQQKEVRLSPSPRADRRTLIRRLYLVMHGMPPAPEDVEAFVGNNDVNAYEKLVDRVLASPRLGERWGRHWLDVVRYADTNGFETNRQRETAYHYRDYIIDALNADKPYVEFVIEQLAGDAVGADVATGFLVAGPYDVVKSPDINLTLMQRQDELADMVNTTGTAFLGVTIGCARCHNHKFDPILQKDYYAMQAVFAGVNYGERRMQVGRDEARMKRLTRLKSNREQVQSELTSLRASAFSSAEQPLRPAVTPRLNTETFPVTTAKFVRFTIMATNSSEPCIDELEVYDREGDNVALAVNGTKATASGSYPDNRFHKLEHINDGLFGNEHSWISDTNGKGWVQLEFPQRVAIEKVVWGRDRHGRYADRLAIHYRIEASSDGIDWTVLARSTDREPFPGDSNKPAFLDRLNGQNRKRAESLLTKKEDLEREIAGLEAGPQGWLANFVQPDTTHRLYRGDPMQKREPVAPDTLTVLGSLGMGVDEVEQTRRLNLARWIASRENPLTARVLVNRLWHYIFGTGIVETPSDFGLNGASPSHPELLDWLADEFMKSRWSVKHSLRLILSSNTFQQSGEPREAAAQIDAGARFLWRFPRRRLEAEAIRDSILAVSGALNLKMHGPGFYLHRVQVENVMHYFPKESVGPDAFRRMVYLFKIRQEQDAIFGAFDCPDGNQVIPDRSRSNTPLQALNLFNSPFIMQQAEILANRLEFDGGPDVAKQITRAFGLFYARPPDAFEMEASRDLIAREGMHAFCRALYNSSEFLFIF